MDAVSLKEQETEQQEMRLCLHRFAILFLSIILTAVQSFLDSLSPNAPRQQYHTLILTGNGWVLELLAGHPECIHCELGMHQHVFVELI